MDQAIYHFGIGLLGKSPVFDFILKFLAIYLIYLVPVFLVLYWFLASAKIALRAFLAGIFAWVGFSNLIGSLYFRARPFVAWPEKEFIFHRPTYSFPSDHAAFLFALALSFWLAGKKTISYWLFAISIVISLARVFTGLHWASDVLAGWGLGILAAEMIWLIREPLDKYIIEPILGLLRKIRLAP